MPNLERPKKRIQSAQDLYGVVKTMKSLAMVNIRHFEQAAEAVQEYYQGVEMALSGVLRANPIADQAESGQSDNLLILIGSDQGMCGQFNSELIKDLEGGQGPDPDAAALIWVIGQRLASLVSQPVDSAYSLPGSVGQIGILVQELLIKLEQAIVHSRPKRVYCLYNRPEGKSGYSTISTRVHPLPDSVLSRNQGTWPGKTWPLYRVNTPDLMRHLTRQYLFVALSRALALSLAAENTARLRAMQGAEDNLKALLEQLQTDFHRLRQTTITEELLDIITGFESLRKGRNQQRGNP
jgi:F-type H+-transporting ATPase subunit gamma